MAEDDKPQAEENFENYEHFLDDYSTLHRRQPTRFCKAPSSASPPRT